MRTPRSALSTSSVLLLVVAAGCSSSSTATVAPVDGGHDASPLDATRRDGAPGDAAADGDAAPQVATPNAPPLLTLDCDPMVPTECGFPFPSNVWTVPDNTTPTGLHLYFGDATLPLSKAPIRFSKAPLLTRDGFAQGAVILTHLPGATVTGLPTPTTVAASVTKTSPTIVMEADTGALVPHFSELDVLRPDLTDQAFEIDPVVRLKDATRYIVAIRHVLDASGAPLPANPVFAALRDNTPSTDLSVPPRRALYADIMSKLTANGITTSDLQLAWDFTTASQANTTGWMVHMRDDALAKVGAKGPSYTIDSVDTNPNAQIALRLHGTMTVPLYTSGVTLPVTLNLGPDGQPAANGTATFPFLVHIPNSLVTAKKAGPILLNAHGLFGDQSEGQNSYLADICDREGYVAISVNLTGMDTSALFFVGMAFGSDPAQFEGAIELQHQGLLNELLAIRMMMGGLATDAATQPAGVPTIDPTQRFYRGDSQGGIFGGTFMSISTDVTRGLLGEPGAPYSLILNRSADFTKFYQLLELAYANERDIQFAIALIDTLWFRTEPGGYVGYIGANMLPNTPSHDVLIHAGLGDHQVTPLGAEFVARSVGAKSLMAVNQELFGITDAPSGFGGSGIVEWGFGLPPAPITDTPATAGADPHDELRFVRQAQDMADQFFRTGLVNQTCPDGGPCVVTGCDAGLESCTAGP